MKTIIKNETNRTNIFVIGASVGGFHVLKAIIQNFPSDFQAAVFVVLHIEPERKSFLAEIFGRKANVPVISAKNGDLIKQGHVYIAVPDFHMRLTEDKIRLDHGPRHNFSRPAIDPLFSSAAKVFGPRVVGVILSGALDDGCAGLLNIKRNGGTTIVQDPNDAVNPSMPENALDCVPVDYCVPFSEMSSLLIKLAGQPVRTSITTKGKNVPAPSKPKLSTHICPECNGPMWMVEDGSSCTFIAESVIVSLDKVFLSKKRWRLSRLYGRQLMR